MVAIRRMQEERQKQRELDGSGVYWQQVPTVVRGRFGSGTASMA